MITKRKMRRNFPFVLQHDSMQCGVACLAMICSYFKKNKSMNYLSEQCFATTEGVSLLAIDKVASQLGLETISGRVSVNTICNLENPCILHWNQNHFVVLYKVKKGKTFYIADPGKGLVKYNLEEFKKHWVSTQSDGEEKGHHLCDIGIADWCILYTLSRNHQCKYTDDKYQSRHNIHSL